jgi:carbonic anhydrase
VKHVVVIGHAQCGGVRFLADQATKPRPFAPQFQFLAGWVRIAEDAYHALAEGVDAATAGPLLEQAGVVTSLRNLMSFPWIRERVETGALALHGWYFDLAAGRLLVYDADECRFVAAHGTARPVVGAQQALPDPKRFVRMSGAGRCCSAA